MLQHHLQTLAKARTGPWLIPAIYYRRTPVCVRCVASEKAVLTIVPNFARVFECWQCSRAVVAALARLALVGGSGPRLRPPRAQKNLPRPPPPPPPPDARRACAPRARVRLPPLQQKHVQERLQAVERNQSVLIGLDFEGQKKRRHTNLRGKYVYVLHYTEENVRNTQ